MDLWHDALEIKTKTNLKQNVIFLNFISLQTSTVKWTYSCGDSCPRRSVFG